jgi:hypothetical protein
MSGSFLRAGRWLVAAVLAATASAAQACLPPPPGWVEPTAEERVAGAARGASDIVYGEIVRGNDRYQRARFRVLHVYKGSARVGSILSMPVGWGLNPPMCAGMLGGPPPMPRSARGERAVPLVFPTMRELNFVDSGQLAIMLRLGLIQPGPHDRPNLQE